MGTIIDFPVALRQNVVSHRLNGESQTYGRDDVCSGSSGAQILLFTGVRISYFSDQDDPFPDEPRPKRKTRRKCTHH